MSLNKLNLSDVALCAIDSANAPLTVRALDKCLTSCHFADAFFLTNSDVKASCRTEKIAQLNSRGAYSHFVLKELIKYIKTPYVLLVQWDGYITNPKAWTSDFLKYDYIGAKWPWITNGHNVGNGGFSLRSRKLLEAVASLPTLSPEDYPEDQQICRYLRPPLEKKFDIKFAPEPIADQFAYEYEDPSGTPFGFHGIFNLWRYVDDIELDAILNQVADYVVLSNPYLRLLEQYFWLNKPTPMRLIYTRIRKILSKQDLHALWVKLVEREDPKLIELIKTGEDLLEKDAPVKR